MSFFVTLSNFCGNCTNAISCPFSSSIKKQSASLMAFELFEYISQSTLSRICPLLIRTRPSPTAVFILLAMSLYSFCIRKNHPVLCKLRGLHESIVGELGACIVREIHAKLLGRVVVCHD
uniref:Uncharacterized protein n=1 Tax=Cucumis melo TaxID=3656 RepID=A0A9I9E554_CUCME